LIYLNETLGYKVTSFMRIVQLLFVEIFMYLSVEHSFFLLYRYWLRRLLRRTLQVTCSLHTILTLSDNCRLSLPTAIRPRVWADQWVGYVSVINEPTGSATS